MKKNLFLKSIIFSFCSLGLLGCISKKDETEDSPIEQTKFDSEQQEDNKHIIEETIPESENPPVEEIEPQKIEEEIVVPVEPEIIQEEEPVVKEEPPKVVVQEEPIVQVEPEIIRQEEPVEEIKEEPIIEEKKEEPPVEEEPDSADEEDSEYERSVSELDVAVSKETFEMDKKEILTIIDNLDTVMKNKDFKAWLTYLDDESIRYYSQKSNLQTASKRLPVRGLRLNSLEDYFNYVFITSRKGTHIDEIRYETESKVKAVQVTKKETLIYYDFIRIDGKWKLHLSQISD